MLDKVTPIFKVNIVNFRPNFVMALGSIWIIVETFLLLTSINPRLKVNFNFPSFQFLQFEGQVSMKLEISRGLNPQK